MIKICVRFASETLGQKMTMQVLLPDGPSPRPDGKWPALYLLHGLSGDETSWMRETALERYAAPLGLAVVMPCVHRSYYTDMAHGNRYWSYISREVPRVAERLFPLSGRREDRFAAGLSMGGYGAFKLGLRCPERFAAVASLSGALHVLDRFEQPDKYPTFVKTYQEAFGTPQALAGSDDDLMAVAARLTESCAPLPKFFQACGTEDFAYGHNQEFLHRFGKALDIHYEEGPGAHTWEFWDPMIQRVLAWLPIQH